jgi:hypothetical protein
MLAVVGLGGSGFASVPMADAGPCTYDGAVFVYDAPDLQRVPPDPTVATEGEASTPDGRKTGAIGTPGRADGSSTTPSPLSVATKAAPTFRGDSRPPSQIFDEGFQPVGNDLDLMNHATGGPNSGYVATSRSSTVAQDFGPNVYEVRAPGGVDVNATLGSRSPFPSELEVAYPGGVPSSCIAGCTLPNGQWVPNPGYRGPQ